MADLVGSSIEDEGDDDSTPLEPVPRKEALKAASILQNYLLQLKKTTPEILSALRKVHDELLLDLNFKKKQTTIFSYFSTLS
ncbi:hypothetical protein LINPERPRIM_LOCUS38363 [Linum perenne]